MEMWQALEPTCIIRSGPHLEIACQIPSGPWPCLGLPWNSVENGNR